MATLTFDSKLRQDGSLDVPEGVAKQLHLSPGDDVRVRIETAAANGITQAANGSASAAPTALDLAIAKMTSRTPEEKQRARQLALERYKPERQVPPGKTLADIVSGQWPGDETDEQINAALEELS